MKLLETKSGVSKYCIKEGLLIIIDVNNQIMSNNEILYSSTEPLQEIYCTNSSIYTNDFNGNGIIISNQEVKLYGGNVIKLIFKDTILFSKDKYTYVYIKGNLTGKLKSKIFIYHYNHQNQTLYYYSKKSNEIIKYNIIQNLQKWKYSLEALLPYEVEKQKIKVKEISGIFNNLLVCTLNNGGILVVDTNNGDKKYYFSNTGVISGLFNKNENTPVFIGLKHWTLIEININNGEILKKIDISQHLKKLANIPKEKPCWLSVGTCKFYDNLFYFYGANNLLVVFDPRLDKIIDHYWFKFEDKNTILKIGNENLQVVKDIIYCLDSKNELYKILLTPTITNLSSMTE